MNAPVGPAICNAAAAEHRHQQPGDDGRVQPLLGLRARGDRERHGQRQRDDADHDAGDDVSRPVCAAQQPARCASSIAITLGRNTWMSSDRSMGGSLPGAP